MFITELLHYATIAGTVCINALSVGIGQGLTSKAALDALDRQPMARAEITKVLILGLALIETAAIMGAFISILLLMGTQQLTNHEYSAYAELGILAAISLTGLVLGLACMLPAQAACIAVARQPFLSQKIIRFTLVAISLIQTPIIFGLIIALFIRAQASTITNLNDSFRLLASGLSLGFGCIGPAIGLGLFARAACTSIGKNRNAYNSIFSFTLISQAIIETPIIFSLIISMSLLFLISVTSSNDSLEGIILIAAALCTGMGTLGPGISSGMTAMAACKEIGNNPAHYGVLSRLSMFAQGLIETSAIYAILVSFFLLFFVR